MTHSSSSTRLSCPAFLVALLTLASCAPLQSYGRAVSIGGKCIAADELRREREPTSGRGSPVPVTPADSVARAKETAELIACNGGLTR